MRPHEQLEHEFAKWVGVDSNTVACCNSGTSALHLAFETLQLPQGSEVVLCDFAMIATARAVSLAGLVPVFVDCGEDLLIDPDAVDAALSRCERPGAILAVHTHGRRCRMQELRTLTRKYGVAVVEDLAEAHGVMPHPRSAAAAWSCYKNKIIAGEEGGLVAFHDPGKASLAKQLRCLGFTEAHDFTHIPRGHNYRLADSLAVLIIDSLRQAGANLAIRRRIEQWYDACCPAGWRMPPRDAVWVYDLRVPGMVREQQDRLIKALREAKIEARHSFKPLSQQPEYADVETVDLDRPLPWHAMRASMEVIYLPCVPGVTTHESCERAFDVIRDELGV